MKRIVLFVCILFSVFLVTGCGKDEVVNNNNSNNIENNSSGETYENIELYSDETKIVFRYETTTYVFYYSGEEITGYHTYIDYGDAATAGSAYQVFNTEKKNGQMETVDKVYTKGKYVVFEFNKSEYEGMEVKDLRTAYSYMEEVKKENK